MKSRIKEFLLANVQIEGRYIGGGTEPEIIVFKDSEDCDLDSFIDSLSSELEVILSDKRRPLSYHEIAIGDRVKDSDNDIGFITSRDDIHNILVDFDNGGKGCYCLSECCKDILYPAQTC